MKREEQVARVRQSWQQPLPRLLIVLSTGRRGQWRKNLGVTMLPLSVLSRAESLALLQRYRNDINEAKAGAEPCWQLPRYHRDETFGAPTAYLTNLRRQLLSHRSLNA